MNKFRVLIAGAGILFVLMAPHVSAEVYKYKDENGRWQFSDTPPADQQAQKLDQLSQQREQVSTDLNVVLQEKYQPVSEVEKATISVVKVQTALGSGSGFFISETGYLVTNRHVIRPPRQSEDEISQQFAETEAQLSQNKKVLASRKSRLKSYKRDLDNFADYIQTLSGDEKAREQEEYKRRKKEYNKYKKDLQKYERRLNVDIRKLTDARNNYRRQHANASVARQFDILLKDETELKASLVKISKDFDLALLKVDGYKLPYLTVAQQENNRQGDAVFAIGSPLGNSDYVTSGIVTSLKKDQIVIDAQILPGNSGGPLINKQGNVIGVNTWKLLSTHSIGSEGFGIAISVDKVLEEFPGVAGEQLAAVEEEGEAPAESSNELLQAIMEDYKNKK